MTNRFFSHTQRLISLLAITVSLASCGGGGGGGSTPDVGVGFNKAKNFDGAITRIVRATDGSGDIYVGGAFSAYNSTAVNNIVRLNSDGSIDNEFDIGTGLDGGVSDMLLANDGSNDIYISGAFRNYNGSRAIRLIRLNSDGSIDAAFDTANSLNGNGAFNNDVNSIALASDDSGDIYVGGSFTRYSFIDHNRLIRLNNDGSIDSGFNIGNGLNNNVTGLAVANDNSNDLYVSGFFTDYNGTTVNRMIRINSNGSIDNAFNTLNGAGFNELVLTITAATDGSNDVYAGGNFTTYNDVDARFLIRLNNDGSHDTVFATGTGLSDPVATITPATDGSGDVFVGGSFSSYNDTEANRLVRLTSTGAINASFITGSGFNDQIAAISPATDGSGNVYIGGIFSSYNGTGINRLVNLNSDGSIDSGSETQTGSGFGFDDEITTFANAKDDSGDIYVGGDFESYNGTPAKFIVRLNNDGSVDNGFDSGSSFGSFGQLVQNIAPATDSSGDIYVGGSFITYNGTSARYLARINSDGTIDNAFDTVNSPFNNPVHIIVPTDDGSGDIYAGGEFITYKGASVNHLVRINNDASIDNAFDTQSGAFNGNVQSIALATDGSGDVYVGGLFTGYNGTEANYLIRLNSDGSIDPAFNTGNGFNAAVQNITAATDNSGDVYVGGAFTDYNGTETNFLVRLNSDGSIYNNFNHNNQVNTEVLSIAATDNGDIYVTGIFTPNGVSIKRLMRLNSNGSIDSGFEPLTPTGNGLDRDINVITLASDSSDVFVGGRFSNYNGAVADKMIRLDADGTID